MSSIGCSSDCDSFVTQALCDHLHSVSYSLQSFHSVTRDVISQESDEIRKCLIPISARIQVLHDEIKLLEKCTGITLQELQTIADNVSLVITDNTSFDTNKCNEFIVNQVQQVLSRVSTRSTDPERVQRFSSAFESTE